MPETPSARRFGVGGWYRRAEAQDHYLRPRLGILSVIIVIRNLLILRNPARFQRIYPNTAGGGCISVQPQTAEVRR